MLLHDYTNYKIWETVQFEQKARLERQRLLRAMRAERVLKGHIHGIAGMLLKFIR